MVTNGAFIIDATVQLNNQKSMMNQNVNIKPQDVGTPAIPDFVANIPDNFKAQLSSISDKYLCLKNALVETDATATTFLQELENVDMTLSKSDAHQYWMQQLAALQGYGKNIPTLNGAEVPRQQFDFSLSDMMIN